MEKFRDRHHAGKELAQRLASYAGQADIVLLALPRGGVPVAYEVSLALQVPLDVWIVRKLGLPGHEELALGAVASGGVRTLNENVIRTFRIARSTVDSVTEREMQELRRREKQYRGNRPAVDIPNRNTMLVDDGLATGASMLAAVRAVRAQNPARITVAVPAAAPQAIELLRSEADEITSIIAHDPFEGVSKWYEDFSQTSDEEVQLLLEEANRRLND